MTHNSTWGTHQQKMVKVGNLSNLRFVLGGLGLTQKIYIADYIKLNYVYAFVLTGSEVVVWVPAGWDECPN